MGTVHNETHAITRCTMSRSGKIFFDESPSAKFHEKIVPPVAVYIGNIHAPNEYSLVINDKDFGMITLWYGIYRNARVCPKSPPNTADFALRRHKVPVELKKISSSVLGDTHMHAAIRGLDEALGDCSSRHVVDPNEHVDSDRMARRSQELFDARKRPFAIHVEARLAPARDGSELRTRMGEKHHPQSVENPHAMDGFDPCVAASDIGARTAKDGTSAAVGEQLAQKHPHTVSRFGPGSIGNRSLISADRLQMDGQ